MPSNSWLPPTKVRKAPQELRRPTTTTQNTNASVNPAHIHIGNLSNPTATTPSLNAKLPYFARSALFALVGLVFAAVTQMASATIPSAERQVLVNLYTSTNGATWTTNTNWNGVVGTECSWYGISCDIAQTHVFNILLVGNNLTGPLPALTKLKSLAVFNVSNNHLTGQLPALTGLTNLANFAVSNNQLAGPIPTLTGLTSLAYFDVNDNQLAGPIPALTGLTNLTGFYAFTNQLVGPLPDLTGLSNLDFFAVYDNQINGTIPILTGLTNLRYFYVSANQLTGPLPDLTGLTNLAGFYVNNNQLSGSVPVPPASLLAAGLCPNLLDTSPGANDAGWNTATGYSPWWATPYANNLCDDTFASGFESQF